MKVPIICGLVLAMCGAACATTIRMDGSVSYNGPDAPPPQAWTGTLTGTFTDDFESVTINFASDSPSGDTSSQLDWTFVDETTRRFFSNGDLTLTLNTLGDWNDGQPLTTENFASRVSSIEFEWYDVQYNPLGQPQTSLALAPPDYQLIAVPEPSTVWLLVVTGLIGFRARRRLPLRLMAVTLVLAATGQAFADEGHSHPDIHTPLGFTLTTERQRDGLTMVVRENGHVIVFAPAGSWFSRDAGPMGASIAWRWQDGPATGPFQSEDCLYESFFGNSVCDADLYALEDGIFDHPTLPDAGRSFNHVELPGHITDLSSLSDPVHFAKNMWIGGTTRSLQRTPEGMKIVEDESFNVGSGPWLVIEGAAVPEPSALALLTLGLLASVCRGRLLR